MSQSLDVGECPVAHMQRRRLPWKQLRLERSTGSLCETKGSSSRAELFQTKSFDLLYAHSNPDFCEALHCTALSCPVVVYE